MINLNNAGCSNLSESARKKIIELVNIESKQCGYDIAQNYEDQIQDVYNGIAKLLKCRVDEVGITKSSTMAWQSIVGSLDWNEGDEVLFDASEYSSNYLFLLKLKKEKGIVLKEVQKTKNFQIDLDDLKKQITSRTKLISIVHIATCNGTINLAKEACELAQKKGILCILDACQSIGQLDVNTIDIECDFLVTSARKFLRGPRGIGFYFIRHTAFEKCNPFFIDLHASSWPEKEIYKTKKNASMFELWESSITLKLALGEAISDFFKIGINEIIKRNKLLREHFIANIDNLEGSMIWEDKDLSSNLITLNINPLNPIKLQVLLKEKSISIGTSKKTTSMINPNFNKYDQKLRVSPHYYNTLGEINEFIKITQNIIKNHFK